MAYSDKWGTASQFLTLVKINLKLILVFRTFLALVSEQQPEIYLSWPGLSYLLQVQVAKYIVNQYGEHVCKSNVAVLTPYRQQLNEISKRLKGAYQEILVTTVIKSQGKQYLLLFLFIFVVNLFVSFS